MNIESWKAKQLKSQLHTLYLAYKYQERPRCKSLAVAIIGDALSPIDLIPRFYTCYRIS